MSTATKQREIGGSGLRLLPATSLLKTNDVDHANWNYRPLLGMIQRMRFKLIRSLLRGRRYHRLLEVGYGSGIFMPELARHADELYGIDPHPQPDGVMRVLAEHGIEAQLVTGTASDMPYSDGMFDAIVVVSALEFIPDLDAACVEMKRVLAPGGVLVVVTPSQSPLLDFGLKVLTGENADNDFGDRRKAILPTLLKHFNVQKRLDRPRVVQHLVQLYTALRLEAK